MLNVTILGQEFLALKLQVIQDKIKDTGALSLIKRAAMAVVRQAMKNASGRPGPRVRTGRLRSSINAEILSYDKAKVGTNVIYAAPVEFGHYTQGSRTGISYGHMTPAYPFLNPAAEQVKGEIDGITITYASEIEEEFGK